MFETTAATVDVIDIKPHLTFVFVFKQEMVVETCFRYKVKSLDDSVKKNVEEYIQLSP